MNLLEKINKVFITWFLIQQAAIFMRNIFKSKISELVEKIEMKDETWKTIKMSCHQKE